MRMRARSIGIAEAELLGPDINQGVAHGKTMIMEGMQ